MKKTIAINQIVRVSLSVIMARGGKVLMGLRQGTEIAKGLWAYPGGKMDFGETPTEGVIREVEEETGLIIWERRLRFLRYVNEPFPKEDRHYVNLLFFILLFKKTPSLVGGDE